MPADTTTFDVTAFAVADGWRFRVDLYDRQPEGMIHTEAVGARTFPTEAFAIAQGADYAAWLASDREGEPPTEAIDQRAEARRLA